MLKQEEKIGTRNRRARELIVVRRMIEVKNPWRMEK